MPPILVELRPNRRLLDHDFDGYKLNLSALPHWSLELQSPVDKVNPDDTQYSFLHAKLFALHNHLIADQWSHRYTFYYIDNQRKVRRIHFDSENHTFQVSNVYTVPVCEERRCGHFNLSLKFPSSDIGLISDGTGYLHIVTTDSRGTSDTPWKTVHSSQILGEDKYFIIIDCRCEELNDSLLVHCLVQSVEQCDSNFNSVLTWVTFSTTKSYTEWKQNGIKQMQGKGVIHYAAIESTFTALYIAADHQFTFINDDGKTTSEAPEEEHKIMYTWLQTMEDINICLQLPHRYDKGLLHVQVTPLTIKVTYAGTTFVNGTLMNKVDSELTTWNVQEDGKVDILLTKSESQLWSDFMQVKDPSGEQIMDASLVEEAHRRLSHLCSERELEPDKIVPGLSTQQLEECDAVSDEDTTLVRIDAVSHAVTHRIPLSVHHYLFNIPTEANEVPAIALRHDVDTCLWQPYAKLPHGDQWLLQHQGTLSAFGYIQSSKQNRKFVTCPPNFSYSVVCEASRHIFIYKNIDSTNGCQLRKRDSVGSTRKVNVGHQHVFNVERYGQVLGVHATNSHLLVLTESMMVAIQIN